MTERDGEPKDAGVRRAGTLIVAGEGDDDADLDALAMAVGGNAPSVPPASDDDDDGRLDLRSLSASALISARPSAAAGPAVRAEPPARPPGEPDAADAPAASPSASALPSLRADAAAAEATSRGGAHWLMPLAAGFGLGVVAGALLFGGASPAAPAASEGAAELARGPAPSEAPAELASGQARPIPEVEAVPTVTDVAAFEPASPRARTHAGAAVAAAHARPARAAEAAPPPAPLPAAPADEGPVVRLTPKPADPAPAAQDPETPANAASGPRSVDQLLDEALSGDDPLAAAKARSKPRAPGGGPLPATPSREEVTRAMAVLLPAIRGCAMGQSGMATAGIVVRNDGRVASVSVSGAPFAGSASGRCMEGVVRRARFPRFSQPTFRVRYPLAIQ